LPGIALTKLTGWLVLDGIVAKGAAIDIIWTRYQLIIRSASGLLDTALSKDETEKINKVLEKYKPHKIIFHYMMTRQSGQHKFISVQLLIPGK